MLREFVQEIVNQAKPVVVEANEQEYLDSGYNLAESKALIEAKESASINEYANQAQLQSAYREFKLQAIRNKTEQDNLDHFIASGISKIKLENTSFEKKIQNIENDIKESTCKQRLRDLKPARNSTFNSIHAFTDFIKHEAKESENLTGKGYFLLINQAGGNFITDFDTPKDIFTYERRKSPIFNFLVNLKESRNFSQKQLLEFILENKNYINNYAEAFNGFKKIKNTKTTKMDAEPMLVGDETSERFEMVQSWEYNGELKKEKVTLIPELEMTIPVILMSNKEYKLNLSVTPTKGCNDTIEFDLFAPGLEYLLALAMKEEVELVKDQLQHLTDAYIGLDI